MNRRRGLLLFVLIYVALDFSLPAMPGAFVFDPAGSVEVARGRVSTDLVVLPTPPRGLSADSQTPQSDPRPRWIAIAQLSRPWRAPASRLPRAAATTPSSSEDPH